MQKNDVLEAFNSGLELRVTKGVFAGCVGSIVSADSYAGQFFDTREGDIFISSIDPADGTEYFSVLIQFSDAELAHLHSFDARNPKGFSLDLVEVA